MIKRIIFSLTMLACIQAQAQMPGTYYRKLNNGLEIIVCEKRDNKFAEVEVWYKTGSKDEKNGIRGMAHMFEHMMFRGTTKYPGNFLEEIDRKFGWQSNAYTTYDRTVYHEYIPADMIEKAMDIEADRMVNLNISQEVLNTEREVVGEEYRNGINNWYGKMNSDRYPLLYPENHPYAVDVIGNLNEITSFTTDQCMEFYNNYYSPDNAFLVITGNVSSADIFRYAEIYFGKIGKHHTAKKTAEIPNVYKHKLSNTEMDINFPMQIYSFIIPKPAANDSDFMAFTMLSDLLIFNSNSVLNNRLVKQDRLAYGINANNDLWSLYPGMMVVDVFMSPYPGNIKVKKAMRDEIDKIISGGFSKENLEKYLLAKKSEDMLQMYSSEAICQQLGYAHLYLNDYQKAQTKFEEYKKITPVDLMKVAQKYFSEDKIQMINIKPEEN